MPDSSDEKKKRGRPRKNDKKDGATRVREYRKRMNEETSRYDIYIGLSASNLINKLATSWNYTISQSIERLILESQLRYKDIIHSADEDFPEGIPDHIIEAIIKEKLNDMLSSKRGKNK